MLETNSQYHYSLVQHQNPLNQNISVLPLQKATLNNSYDANGDSGHSLHKKNTFQQSGRAQLESLCGCQGHTTPRNYPQPWSSRPIAKANCNGHSSGLRQKVTLDLYLEVPNKLAWLDRTLIPLILSIILDYSSSPRRGKLQAFIAILISYNHSSSAQCQCSSQGERYIVRMSAQSRHTVACSDQAMLVADQHVEERMEQLQI